MVTGDLFSILLVSLVPSLLVRFDGALRSPYDPGFLKVSLQPIAACAACVSVVDVAVGNEDRNRGDTYDALSTQPAIDKCESNWCVSRRILDPTAVKSSAEAEYEGLILGLEMLMAALMGKQHGIILPALQAIYSPDKGSDLYVLVQGDCKTVINQMKGRSLSRKLEDYHIKAESLLEAIKEEGLGTKSVRFIFEHIPRASNHQCDLECSLSIQEQEVDMYEKLQVELDELTGCKQTSQEAAVGMPLASPQSLSIPQFVASYFGTKSSKIPFSKRPAIYQELASICKKNQDYAMLLEIGDKLEYEAKNIWKKADLQVGHRHQSGIRILNPLDATRGVDKDIDEDVFDLDHFDYRVVLGRAYQLQLDALEGLGRNNECESLTQKLNRLHVK